MGSWRADIGSRCHAIWAVILYNIGVDLVEQPTPPPKTLLAAA